MKVILFDLGKTLEEQEALLLLGRLAEERVEAYRDVLGIYQNLFFKL